MDCRDGPALSMASTRQAGVAPDRTGPFGRTGRLLAGAMPDWRTIFAGSAGFYGILLLALIGTPLAGYAVIPFALAIACLSGSLQLLSRPQGGLLFAGVAVIVAHTVLAVLVTE